MKSDTLSGILTAAMEEYGDYVDRTDDLGLRFILSYNNPVMGKTHHGYIYDDFVLIKTEEGLHAVHLEHIHSVKIKDPRLKKERNEECQKL